jgi:hypothetical protein
VVGNNCARFSSRLTVCCYGFHLLEFVPLYKG